METTNALGLDKFQLTIIKGNYNSLKPIIAKRNKLSEKIKAAAQKEEAAINAIKQKTQESLSNIYKEIAIYNEQIEALDKITKTHTNRVCGVELTTEQVMKFLDNPDEYKQYRYELGLDNNLFNQQEKNTEEVQLLNNNF